MSGHSKWENIKRKKGKTDAIRARITTKFPRKSPLQPAWAAVIP